MGSKKAELLEAETRIMVPRDFRVRVLGEMSIKEYKLAVRR